ncbi:MAG: hypothetical protein K8R23_04060 [Chthoniobacter sp.]|nr:hypothetical protein [Chthoniobacter sp.]
MRTAIHPAQTKNALTPLLAVIALLAGLASGIAAPLLISAQQASYRTRPEYLRDHFAHIETLPFDGLAISTATGSVLMSGTVRSAADMADDFAPLNGLAFTRMRHNFALVNVDRPADFFGDWSGTVENFRQLAKVLREKGLSGIFFDNEEYKRSIFNFPDDCSDPTKTLEAYRAQAQLRGRQIAQAISEEFPEIVLMAYHGPYSSFSATPAQVRGNQTAWDQEELRGAFSAGLIAGLDSRAQFVDGGEVYAYRTVADFQVSYDYRKTALASAATDCPFIPAALRSVWSAKVGISFGVYNYPFGGSPMDPAILRPTLERALRRCDDFVWLYFEDLNWNAPGEIPQSWVDAVVGARADAQTPVVNAPPSVSLTSPGPGVRLTRPGTVTLTAAASDADGTISKVEFFSGATKLGESLAGPFSLAWPNPAAGTFSLTAKATDNTGATATSSVVTVVIGTAFAANINFQPVGSTPPIGYFPDTGDTYGSRGNGLTYGWNITHTTETRDRHDSVDRRLSTLCQLRSGGVWQLALPNGTYQVTVGIGDGSNPSLHTINVEGVNYWTAQSLSAGQFVNRTLAVTVSDGLLTIDQGAAANAATRLDYVLIAPASTPPAAPGSLSVNATSPSTVTVRWYDHSSNETTFTLQRSTSADFSGALQTFTLPTDETSRADTGLASATTYYYRLRADNSAGSSDFSNIPAATTPILDTDLDGIPDAQETAPFIVGLDDRLRDADGDGFSNAAELAAGTDPLASLSRPRFTQLTTTQSAAGTTSTLTFPTTAARRYAVDFTDSLPVGIWTLLPGSLRLGDGTPQTLTDTTLSPTRLYRLRVWP